MLLFIVVVLVVILTYLVFGRTKLEAVPDLAGRKWFVVSRFANKRDAAKLISAIHGNMVSFMSFLKAKYRIDYTDEQLRQLPFASIDSVRAAKYKHMLQNYNPDTMYENDPASGSTSYTVDKGSKTYLCLRDKRDMSKFIDMNTILFVVLHEVAHIANYSNWGHGPEFWRTFAEILHEAEESGVYKPVNYAKTPAEYCGLLINYNPYWT